MHERMICIYEHIYIHDVDACFELQEKASGMMEKACNAAESAKESCQEVQLNINVLTN
jgi:hypothetical protein